MPDGCTCLEPWVAQGGNEPASNCEKFDCECSCDLTASICDRFCPCDEDCGGQRWSISNHEISTSLLPTCSEIRNRQAKKVSAIGGFITNAAKNLLCIQRDNSAVKGSFFTSDLHTSRSEKNKISMDFSRIGTTTDFHSALNEAGNYVSGDSLQLVLKKDSGGMAKILRMSLPSSSDSGFCNELNVVEFGVNSNTQCSMVISNLKLDCKI